MGKGINARKYRRLKDCLNRVEISRDGEPHLDEDLPAVALPLVIPD